MKVPTPAELAMFAQAIGWAKVLGCEQPSPSLWTKKEIHRLLVQWIFWNRWINEEAAGLVDAQKRLDSPETYHTAEEAKTILGTKNIYTLRKWCIAALTPHFGPDGAESAWVSSRARDSFPTWWINAMEAERDRLKKVGPSAGGRAKAVK